MDRTGCTAREGSCKGPSDEGPPDLVDTDDGGSAWWSGWGDDDGNTSDDDDWGLGVGDDADGGHAEQFE